MPKGRPLKAQVGEWSW